MMKESEGWCCTRGIALVEDEVKSVIPWSVLVEWAMADANEIREMTHPDDVANVTANADAIISGLNAVLAVYVKARN